MENWDKDHGGEKLKINNINEVHFSPDLPHETEFKNDDRVEDNKTGGKFPKIQNGKPVLKIFPKLFTSLLSYMLENFMVY